MDRPADIAISDFTYDLPEERIAVRPLLQRDQSKLLVYDRGRISESQFSSLPDFLPQGACLLFNDSRVVHARLYFETGEGHRIEIFCLQPSQQEMAQSLQSSGSTTWQCMVGNLKKWKQPEITLSDGGLSLHATVVSREQAVIVRFSWTPSNLTFSEVLAQIGHVPIPPYLSRADEQADKTVYQTVYAKHEGSVAAPTAGLHFTPRMLKRLEETGFGTLHLTLHVSAGTFLPVKAPRLGDHHMHAESIVLRKSAIESLLHKKDILIAVGTTSLRVVESVYWLGVKSLLRPDTLLHELSVEQWDAYDLSPCTKEEALSALLEKMLKEGIEEVSVKTSLLMAPPYRTKMAAGLITNFHQPKSTLLLLVAALVGDDWKKIYDHALNNGFRFLSFGDSSLILF